MSAGLTWQQSPEVLIKGLQQYQEKMLAAVYAAAMEWGQRIQDKARKGARWEDRTGNARSGIYFAVDGFGLEPIVGELGQIAVGKSGQVMKYGTKSKRVAERRNVAVDDRSRIDIGSISGSTDRLVIVLSHTMWYGKYLELSHGGSYAIIMSTIESNLPTLEAMLKGLVK